MATNAPAMRNGGPLNWLKVPIAIFVLVSCLRAWMPVTLLERAEAQIPDAGLQRKQTIEAVERTNLLLTEIRDLLATGPLNVRIAGADNPAGAKPPRAKSP